MDLIIGTKYIALTAQFKLLNKLKLKFKESQNMSATLHLISIILLSALRHSNKMAKRFILRTFLSLLLLIF